MEIDVLSYGETLSEYKKSDNISIGINYICKKVQTDFVLLLDQLWQYDQNGSTNDILWNQPRKGYFCLDNNWLKHLYYEPEFDGYFFEHDQKRIFIPIGLCKDRADIKTLDNHCEKNFNEKFIELPYSYNSPFVACCIAYRMGAKQINLYGVDFINNKEKDICINGLSMNQWSVKHFELLYKKLSEIGVEMRVTKKSKLAEFIPIL